MHTIRTEEGFRLVSRRIRKEKDMTNQEYREKEGVSRSELFTILTKTPKHYKYCKENPAEPSNAMIFGSAAHKFILEHDDFFKEYAVAPIVDRRTKEGKEIYNKFITESEGKVVLNADDYQKIQDMAKAIDEYTDARAFLNGDCEQSFFWTDQSTGEVCKVRPDCLTTVAGKKYIVDYKTTDSCADGHFERSCRKYGYQMQAGMYCEGLFENTFDEYGFVFVAQEKTAPYAIRIYICSEGFIDEGFNQFREALGKYHICKETDNWYGYEGYFGICTELAEGDE